uniref:Secreted 28 n=1 Tax=Tetranychus evansi TaxID=178897 RepID=A0A3G5AP84_9ACAR|nr:secreted 28 [Tetranychus evansi]
MRFALILTLCLVGVASAGSFNKRFINEETLKQQAIEFKSNLEKLRSALLNRFQGNDDVSAEVVVKKRDLLESFEKLNKFAQTKAQEALNNLRQVIDNLFKKNPFFQSSDETESTTGRTIVKRNIFQQLERMNARAQAEAQKVFHNLEKAFQSLFKPFKHNDAEDSTERPISKRNIFDSFERLNEKIQSHAEKAFNDLKRIFDDLFQRHPGSHEIEIEIEDGEVTTGRPIEKRDIFDFFGRVNEKAQNEAAKIFKELQKTFEDLFKGHKHEDADDEEDSTEKPIEKRDIFDFLGEFNEKIQDQAAKFFNRFHKSSPKPDTKPVIIEDDNVVEDIEVVTIA